jgi:2-succinyl-6-hydroxy-2,4-cyclohexadiene-1-carboxylate synthase
VLQTVVLLHGFAGTPRAWDGVSALLPRERLRPLALDLPGHGAQADARRPISFGCCVAHVLARAPARFTLCGYSLGGRVALHVALAAPARVSRLVLVSTSAGIEDATERAKRRAADGALADELERAARGGEAGEKTAPAAGGGGGVAGGVAQASVAGDFDHAAYDAFIERWRAQPLFAEESPGVRELARADQRRNRPDALAAVLRGVGAGEMAPLWGRLGELGMPATVMVGERDAKYRALGRRMTALLPHGELVVVPGGHGLPLENPAAVAQALARLGALA